MEYTTRDYFIPFTRDQITKMLLDNGELNNDEVTKFEQFCLLLKSIYHFEFHEQLENLKSSYRIFNPDINLVSDELENSNTSKIETNLTNQLHQVLTDGNYVLVSNEDLQAAMNEEGLIPVSAEVDFSHFDYYEIHYLGTRTSKEKIKTWNPFVKKEVDFEIFENIVFFFKVKNEEFFHLNKIKKIPGVPGKIYLKFLCNIPKSDLEMIFPNPRPQMNIIHKFKIIVPLIIGLYFLLKKTVIPYFFSSSSDPIQEVFSIGFIALLIAIGGYIFKSYTKYLNLVQRFLSEITQSLYFKDRGNNQGVFSMLIDLAEEQECKEAMMAYYFLLKSNVKMNEKELDNFIEEWMEKKHKTKIDFEVDDAIKKLEKLNLMSRDKNGILTVLSMDEALSQMDYIWDNYFEYNKPENI